MWKLEKPTMTSRQTYLACISRVRNAALRTRLGLITTDIVRASAEFESAASKARLHTLVTTNTVGGQVTKDEMSDVYTLRMAKMTGPGRSIYDELLAAPAHGRCPLCGQRTVSTLDHHLPKAYFPALAVAPPNLVPACSDCNKAKMDSLPETSEEETFHPYFDDIENDVWLRAEIIEMSPAALRFFVAPPDHWDETTAARAHRHFELLNLSYLYASHSAEELLNIRFYLSGLFAESGSDTVRRHLLDKGASCAQARANSWQTATYTALAASEWFCAGGFA
jgi:hypothetical protein